MSQCWSQWFIRGKNEIWRALSMLMFSGQELEIQDAISPSFSCVSVKIMFHKIWYKERREAFTSTLPPPPLSLLPSHHRDNDLKCPLLVLLQFMLAWNNRRKSIYFAHLGTQANIGLNHLQHTFCTSVKCVLHTHWFFILVTDVLLFRIIWCHKFLTALRVMWI